MIKNHSKIYPYFYGFAQENSKKFFFIFLDFFHVFQSSFFHFFRLEKRTIF